MNTKSSISLYSDEFESIAESIVMAKNSLVTPIDVDRKAAIKNSLLSKFAKMDSVGTTKPATVSHLRYFALAAAAVMILAVGSLALKNMTKSASPAEQNQVVAPVLTAMVDSAIGQIEKQSLGESTWLSAGKGDTLAVGDKIRTLTDAQAVLVFEGNSEARLDANTTVELRVLLAAHDSSGPSIHLDLEQGQIYSRVVGSGDRHPNYQVSTPQLIISATGTAFSSYVDPQAQKTKAIAIEHAIKVKYNDVSLDLSEGTMIEAEESADQVITQEIDETTLTSPWLQQNKTADQSKGYRTGVYEDTTPPTLSIDGSYPATQTEGIANLCGQVLEGKYLWVNGAAVTINSDGSFCTEVSLIEGENSLTLLAKDAYYNRTSQTVIINYQPEVTTAPAPRPSNPDPSNPISLVLSGSSPTEGVAKLSWSYNGNSPAGFKVVKSASPNPVYPGNDSHYLSNASARSDQWEELSSGKYHFRVCTYNGNGVCLSYSNDIAITVSGKAEPTPAPSVQSISLASGANGLVKWTVNGYSAQGFKVVWSKNTGPTYPTRSGDQYHYHTDPAKRTDTVDSFAGPGTYYVRVCEYLGGKCGVYSNEITVNFATPPADTPVTSIVLSGTNANISWVTTGHSDMGFKVVWSRTPSPVYPGSHYNYYSNPDRATDVLDAYDGTGTYCVRVCEYLGGTCGVYSNQITVNL